MSNKLTVNNPTSNPYLTTGYRTYMIGGQDGTFPEKGEHVAKEMYGIWSMPIKVCDGFWLKVNDEWLTSPSEFEIFPYAAEFHYPIKNQISSNRFQFIPDDVEGVYISYSFKNESEIERKLSIEFVLKSELFPVWLSERMGIQDFSDNGYFDEQNQLLQFKDEGNPWYLLAGTSHNIVKTTISKESDAPLTIGKGIYGKLEVEIQLKPQSEETVSFFLASSSQSREDAQKNYNQIAQNHDALLEAKQNRYQKLEEQAVLTISDASHFEELYRWTKYNNDWAIRNVPRQGKGVVAGYPEFPWWFGHDSTYFLKSYLLTGDYEICRQTMRLIRQASDKTNGNGRVVHEIASNGEVYYEGMLTETPQFATLVYTYYQWTGDREFLLEMFPFIKQGVKWVQSQCVDGLPYGYGAAEYAGFDCIVFDCAIWTIRGYEVFALMAKELGYNSEYEKYNHLFKETQMKFHEFFWLPKEQMYADMGGTREEIIERAKTWKITLHSFPLDEAGEYEGGESCEFDKMPQEEEIQQELKDNMDRIIAQATKMSAGERKAFNFLGLSGLELLWEFGYLPKDWAKTAHENLSTKSVMPSTDELRYGTMPIGTARIMQKFARENNPDEIFNALEYLYRGFGAVMPGATSEYYPNKGCFVQTWNNEATMTVYAQAIFGIEVSAHNKRVSLTPCISEKFGNLSLEKISIGDVTFDFYYDRESKTITVSPPNTDWEIVLDNRNNEAYQLG